jgi:hypothetical protein
VRFIVVPVLTQSSNVFGVEGVAEGLNRSNKAAHDILAVVVMVGGGGGVDGGSDLWLVDPVEEHSKGGDRQCQAGGVTGFVERGEAGSEQGVVEVAVNGFEPGGVASDDRFREWESSEPPWSWSFLHFTADCQFSGVATHAAAP